MAAINGVSSSIHVNRNGILTGLSVAVDVTHNHVGDLSISLKSPAGTVVILRNEEGEDTDDLMVTYTLDNAPLGGLIGENISGDWSLHLIDHELVDVGRLYSWNISFDFDPDK